MGVSLRYGGETFDGELRAVSPEVANNEVIVRVRFLDGAPTGLRQNQRVSATILLERKPDTLFVQRGPFLDSGNGRVVYVVDGDVAVRRQVRIGSVSINAVEILEGVSAGEALVISSTDAFRAAQTVRLTD
jgi:HlyD family secretion protein